MSFSVDNDQHRARLEPHGGSGGRRNGTDAGRPQSSVPSTSMRLSLRSSMLQRQGRHPLPLRRLDRVAASAGSFPRQWPVTSGPSFMSTGSSVAENS